MKGRSSQGRIVALGEVLLRLSPPGRKLIRQSSSLDIEVGGAEANVLAALSALGHETALVSCLPDNPLGSMAKATIASNGIDTRHIAVSDGRVGLYFFENGQGWRPSRIIYDREGSSFANADFTQWNLSDAIDGARLLHLSGITPALGEGPSKLALAAARIANELGVPVSFDGNFRAQLWAAWDSKPQQILAELIGCSDVLIGNHMDITLVTGREFSGDGEQRRKAAADAAFESFPRLKLIASTARHVFDSDRHGLSARVDTRNDEAQTEEIIVDGIIDRIGTGDAFAAGVLHRWLEGAGCESIARTGLALAALKHSITGDACFFEEEDIAAFWQGNRDVRR